MTLRCSAAGLRTEATAVPIPQLGARVRPARAMPDAAALPALLPMAARARARVMPVSWIWPARWKRVAIRPRAARPAQPRVQARAQAQVRRAALQAALAARVAERQGMVAAQAAAALRAAAA